MVTSEIIQSWRDPVFRNSIPPNLLSKYPNPVGEAIEWDIVHFSPDTPSGTYACCQITQGIAPVYNADTPTGTYYCCPGCR